MTPTYIAGQIEVKASTTPNTFYRLEKLKTVLVSKRALEKPANSEFLDSHLDVNICLHRRLLIVASASESISE
jgi:hypothetical protein